MTHFTTGCAPAAVLVILLSFAPSPSSARAQGGPGSTLLGVGYETAAVPAAAASPSPVTYKDEILTKLRADRDDQRLTGSEFLFYLRALELANPGLSWAQLSTRLHHQHYAADSDSSYFGVRLFKNGSENQGWENVELMGAPVPKFIVGHSGKLIDISHSYAGVRALVERWSATGEVMGHVNTGVGDGVQVWGTRIKTAGSYVQGATTLDYATFNKAANAFENDDAQKFAPPQQISGNDVGMRAQKYLRDHRDAKLSDAFAEGLTGF